MLDLASTLPKLHAAHGQAAWPDQEYVKGWGVFALPFDSGHLLALRVFPEGSFSPYVAVWHRHPAGSWSIYVDGEHLDTACPRYFGGACIRTGYAHIALTWTGRASLHVTMDSPSLDWAIAVSSTPLLDALNAVGARLPLATWRSALLVRAREALAATLGMGRLRMSGTTPSGYTATLMPRRMYLVDEAHAVLDGRDLGHPTRLDVNPTIGEVPLPARGVLAIGTAVFRPQGVVCDEVASTTTVKTVEA